MHIEYGGQTIFQAAANGDFPLVVLLWGMALGNPTGPVDLLVECDENGNSLLHYVAASVEDSIGIVQFLMQQIFARPEPQTYINATNNAGETPLIRAAHVGNLSIFNHIVATGIASIHAKDKDGNSSLHHAASQGHIWVVHYILELQKKLNILLPKEDYDAVLEYAKTSNHQKLVSYLQFREIDGQASGSNQVISVNDIKCRMTNVPFVLITATMWFAIFQLPSYYSPWWLACVLALLGNFLMFKILRKRHSHKAQATGTNVHPSKRKAVVPPNVSLSTNNSDNQRSNDRFTITSPLQYLRAQPEMAISIWLAWVIFCSFFYIILWIDPKYHITTLDHDIYWFYLICLAVLQSIFLIIWLRLAILCPYDPGAIAPITFIGDFQNLLNMAATAQPFQNETHCRTCLIEKPLRSKHCAGCGICIARLDHHCTWINRCVGYGNHRLFLAFLILHNVTLLMYIGLTCFILFSITSNLLDESSTEDSNFSITFQVWMKIPTLLSSHFIAVHILAWGLAAEIAIAMMLQQQLKGVWRNVTINERINWRRYQHFVNPKSSTYSNPFDGGLRHNLLEFLSKRVDYRIAVQAENALVIPERRPFNRNDVEVGEESVGLLVESPTQ